MRAAFHGIRVCILPVLIGVVMAIQSSAHARTNLLVAMAETEDHQAIDVSSAVEEQIDPESMLPELTLGEATDMALANNHALAMARQAIEIARAQGRSALSQFLPDLSTTYAYTRLGAASVISVPNVGEYVLQPAGSSYWALMFSYRYYTAGRRESVERASEAGAEAARYQADQAEMLIRLGVMQAYTGILEAQAGLDAARKSLDHLDEVLRSAQANYEAGYLPLSDLLAVEVAQLQMQQTVRQLESGLEMARSALSVLIGADIRDRWALVPVAYPEEEIPYTLDSLWEWALEWRPDLRSIDSQRESLEAQISAIASARRPIVSFDAEYSISGEDLFPSGQEKLQGMISVYWDVHDFGRTDDLVAPYEEQIDLLDIQRAELEGQIMQEVESHFLNVQTQLGNLEVSRIALVQAEEAFRVARRRQEEGLGRMIEVLDAEATLARTEANHAHILYEYYRALTSLAVSTGLSVDDLVALIIAGSEDQQ